MWKVVFISVQLTVHFLRKAPFSSRRDRLLWYNIRNACILYSELPSFLPVAEWVDSTHVRLFIFKAGTMQSGYITESGETNTKEAVPIRVEVINITSVF